MAQENKTKVVIRKLPPYLKQDGFLDAVNKVFEESYDWVSFYPGKLTHRRLVHSRAYLNFKHPEQVYDFYESFNGHSFVNEKGVQFRAEVEYAPYQKIPKGRNKKDLREGTILDDPDYLAFLDELEHPKRTITVTDAQKEETEKAAVKGPIITPLIQYIRDKRASRAAAGREKVGPRISSRDAARKGPLAASLGAASARNVKSSSSEKGSLERKATGNKEDASRKASVKADGRPRRESSTVSESGRSEATSQRPPLVSPRDSTGILRRPPLPGIVIPSPVGDRKKEASSRGGPEKRIVKGALASIIGGGLGRAPRGTGSTEVRKDTDAEGQETGDSGSRSSGRQARRLQRGALEQRSLPVEPSGWGDTADGLSGTPNGPEGASGDWGSENPLAADEAKAKGVPPTTRKEGSSRRGSSRNRSGARKESDPIATGWDDLSEGLLEMPGAGGAVEAKASPRETPGAQARPSSAASNKQSLGGTVVGAQVKIMQRHQGAQPPGDKSGQSGETVSRRPDRMAVGDSSAGPRSSVAPTPPTGSRRQESSGGPAVSEAGSEGAGRGGGRNARRRPQGRGQNQERDPDEAAAAAAAWASLSGNAPGTHVPSDARASEGASAQMRIMQRTGPSSASASSFPLGQNTASASLPAGASEIPRLQQQSGAPGRGQVRSGRQPRHQGPYQPGGRGVNRGGRTGSEGTSSAAPGGPVTRGPGGNGLESGKLDGGVKEYGSTPTSGASGEAAAVKVGKILETRRSDESLQE